MAPFRTDVLPNGLRIAFYDETNRYFGDYHRVCLRVVITCDPVAAQAAAPAGDYFWSEAAAVLDGPLRVEKKLERMGVAGADVAATLNILLTEFSNVADDYMARPDYPKRLAQGELAKRSKPGRYY